MDLSLRTIIAGVMAGVISAALFLIISFVPLLNIAILLFPVPFIIVGVKKGVWAGIISLVVSGLLISIFIHPLLVIVFSAIHLLIIIGLSISFRRNYDFYDNVLISSGSTLISLLALTKIYSLTAGKSIFDYIWDSIRKLFMNEALFNFDMFMDFNKQLGNSFNNITTSKQLAEFFISRLQLLIPSTLILFSLIFGTMIFLVSRLALKHLNVKVAHVPPFAEWRLPRGVVFGFLLLVIVTSIGSLYKPELFEAVQIAASSLVSFVFTIQGLAVVWFFFKKWQLPSFVSWILMIIIYIFVHMLLTFNMGLTVLGVLDQLFGFRRSYNIRKDM